MKSKNVPQNATMQFLPEDEVVRFVAADRPTVLKLAMKGDVPLGHSCGGNGYCTTCRVFVESDLSLLPPRNEVEAEIATERGFTPAERLACQLRAFDGLIVRRPVSMDESELEV